MIYGDISGQLRKWQAEARRRREADAPDRALRLSPEVVLKWTAVARDAAADVEPGSRPCDYAPWVEAIGAAGLRHGLVAHPADRVPETSIASRFRSFLEDVSLPAWPEPRRDLIEFALTVLEADVMLFRSGYAKRHLIHRLRQSSLTGADVTRIEAMLRSAVIGGTGLEEYRAWCKLAGHLVANGRLPELPGWLALRAEGAILTLGIADGRLWQQILGAGLPDAEIKRLAVGGWARPHVNGLAWPDFGTVVPSGQAVNSDEQRIRRNAWRMLDHVLRRVPDVLDKAPAKG